MRYLFLIEPFAYLFRKHVDVGLIDVAALVYQRDSVVDLDIGQFLRLLLPVLVQNEQQFLSTTSRKDRK